MPTTSPGCAGCISSHVTVVAKRSGGNSARPVMAVNFVEKEAMLQNNANNAQDAGSGGILLGNAPCDDQVTMNQELEDWEPTSWA